MKKHLVLLLVLVVFCFGLTFTVNAQSSIGPSPTLTTPVDNSMPELATQAILRAEKRASVVYGVVGVSGDGIVWNDSSCVNSGQLWRLANDKNLSGLLDQMSSYDIRFKIGRPGKITAYMYLCDADDHVVFFCQKSADPVIIKGGGYELPYDFGDMLLGMADIVQLTPPDPDSVKQARICVRNQDGTFKFSEWLTVNADGTIQSATSYCSQQGELVVCRERDGQRWEDWYDLQTGKVLSQEVVMTRFLTKIKDCYDFGVNPYCANIHLWPSMDGLYSNTTVNFTVKGGAKVGLYAWVFNADGRFVQAAYCFVYRKVGETEWTGRKYLTPGEDWSLSLPDDAEIEGCYLFQNLPEANATPVFYDPNAKG